MKQSRKQMDNFDNELEDKLSKLTQIRSKKKLQIKTQLNSNAKEQLNQYSNIKINSASDLQNKPNSNDRPNYSLLLSEENVQSKENSEQKRMNNGFLIEQSQLKTQQKSKSKPQSHSQSQSSKKPQSPLLSQISNTQLSCFFQKYPASSHPQKLDLSYFLAQCLAEFSEESSLPEQQIRYILLDLQKQLTTTDQNCISINALQIAIRKKNNSLRVYIVEKIWKAKYQMQMAKLEERERNMQKKLEKNQQRIASKQKQLDNLQKILADRQKQQSKKQKLFVSKQKQFLERIKNHKKMLQQKSQALTQKFSQHLQQHSQKIQKKINLYQRNMKYRIESMSQKANQIHRLREFKQEEIRCQMGKEIQEKCQRSFLGKLKKYEMEVRELNERLEGDRKIQKQLSQENNKFMKICSKLENKVNKEDAKIKQMMTDIQSKNMEIKQLQFLLSQKQKQNEQLLSKIFDENLSQPPTKPFQKPHKKQQKTQKQQKPSSSKSKSNLKSKQASPVSPLQLVSPFQFYFHKYFASLPLILVYDKQIFVNLLEVALKILTFSSGQGDFEYGTLLDLLMKSVVKGFYDQIDKHIKIEKGQKGDREWRKNVRNLVKQWQIGNMVKSAEMLNEIKRYRSKIQIFRLSVIFSLISQYKQSQNWMKFISQLVEQGQIEGQIGHNMQNQNNFINSLIIKLIYPKHNPNIEILSILTDLILAFKLIGDGKYQNFWKSQVGQLILKDFYQICKLSVQNNQFLVKNNEKIQKVSILIQRLVVFNSVRLKSQYLQTFQQLKQISQGSLLQKNLSSILSTFNQASNILQYLQQDN